MASGSIVLILGSAPDAACAAQWPKLVEWKIVSINNAWRIREDWDYLIFPEDFPSERRPAECSPGQAMIGATEFVPANNQFGGIVYAGATMAFTAGYWALAALRPRVLAYFGCDMIYDGALTHFYGKGSADPLRDDVSLGSLEAKSARLMAFAAIRNCACVNLSENPESRLVFPRMKREAVNPDVPVSNVDHRIFEKAKRAESELGYFIEDGEYWHHSSLFDPTALARVDQMWLNAIGDHELVSLVS